MEKKSILYGEGRDNKGREVVNKRRATGMPVYLEESLESSETCILEVDRRQIIYGEFRRP